MLKITSRRGARCKKCFESNYHRAQRFALLTHVFSVMRILECLGRKAEAVPRIRGLGIQDPGGRSGENDGHWLVLSTTLNTPAFQLCRRLTPNFHLQKNLSTFCSLNDFEWTRNDCIERKWHFWVTFSHLSWLSLRKLLNRPGFHKWRRICYSFVFNSVKYTRPLSSFESFSVIARLEI